MFPFVKVLIFSQMARLLAILEDYLVYRGWGKKYCRIDGSVPAKDRFFCFRKRFCEWCVFVCVSVCLVCVCLVCAGV